MVKIAIYKKNDGALLVIWKTPKENLIGELYRGGEYHRGEWDNRATFNANKRVKHRDGNVMNCKLDNLYI